MNTGSVVKKALEMREIVLGGLGIKGVFPTRVDSETFHEMREVDREHAEFTFNLLKHFHDPEKGPPGYVESFREHMVRNSEVFVWRKDIFSMAGNGGEIFVDAIPKDEIGHLDWSKSKFWYLDFNWEWEPDKKLTLVNLQDPEDKILPIGMVIHAILFSQVITGQQKFLISSCICTSLHEGRPKPFLWANDQLISWETEVVGEESSRWIARFKFLEQKVVRAETHKLPRAERRRRKKAGEKNLPTVKVIYLRDIRDPNKTGGKLNGTRKYSHRWLVSGHWRKQWYPTLQKNKRIWIHGFVKGPGDKPLLPKPTVRLVAR